jgi:hypothetical protein
MFVSEFSSNGDLTNGQGRFTQSNGRGSRRVQMHRLTHQVLLEGFRMRRVAVRTLCLGLALMATQVAKAQEDISLESQAKHWLLEDAPPNPPLSAWLDGLSMMIKEKNSDIDATVKVTTTVLESGLVEVQAKVGPNILLFQVDYSRRKYYSMNKFTTDFMNLIAKEKPLRDSSHQ